MMFKGPNLWLLGATLFCYFAPVDPQFQTFGWMFLLVTIGNWIYRNRFFFEDLHINFPSLKWEPRARTTPSSPQETKLAEAQLHVAWGLVNQAMETKD